MMIIFKILIAIIFTEAITELVVKSEFFYPFRKKLFNSKGNKILNFFSNLVDCGYCFSVWAAMLSVFLIFKVDSMFINYFIYGIVLHRLSNIFHFLIDRIDLSKG